MLEVNEEQKSVIDQVNVIVEKYCQQLKTKNIEFDKEMIFGTANRILSLQLEKTVAKARQKFDNNSNINNNSKGLKTKSINKNESKSPLPKVLPMLKPKVERKSVPLSPYSVIRNLKELPAVINAIRVPKTMLPLVSPKKNTLKRTNSTQMDNSRMNLLQALKKAKNESQSRQPAPPIKDEEDSSEDSIILIDNKQSEDNEVNIDLLPVKSKHGIELPPEIKNEVEFVGTITLPETSTVHLMGATRRKVRQNKQSNLNPDINSDSSSDKSSRRSSDAEEIIPVGDTSLEDLGQERFLKYFSLYTMKQMEQLKTRRTSRRRRTCTSNLKKDFHYGNYDVNYVPVRNNKPQLFSPVDKIRKRKPMGDPLAVSESVSNNNGNKRARTNATPTVSTVTPMIAAPSKFIIIPQQKSILHVSNIVAAACKDMKSCVACDQLEDVENMNACLICYNFYHLQCHTMNRELRERENMCPDCLRQTVEKKKRRLELKRSLNFQVLQAQHKASVKQRHQIQA